MARAYRTCLVFCFCILAAGCFGTGAQVESGRLQGVAQATRESSAACIRAIAENPTFAPIAAKTNLTSDPFPLKMLADTTYPTKREIELLYQLHAASQECRKIHLDGASKYHPLMVTVFVNEFSESDKVWTQAVSGKLSWGKFNQAREDLRTQGAAKLTQANAEIISQLQNQHQFELEQRQRAAAALQQWSYQQQALANQQQAINSMNQPRTVNCNYVGSVLQCNSF
jgi:hypothetical protein